jgi:hypothetical protein
MADETGSEQLLLSHEKLVRKLLRYGCFTNLKIDPTTAPYEVVLEEYRRLHSDVDLQKRRLVNAIHNISSFYHLPTVCCSVKDDLRDLRMEKFRLKTLVAAEERKRTVAGMANALGFITARIAKVVLEDPTFIASGRAFVQQKLAAREAERRSADAAAEADKPAAAEKTEPEAAGRCVVCKDARADVLLHPCRHLALCKTCSGRFTDPGCPLCNRRIAARVVVYLT